MILSDTVGFISSLPTELVASFRATLEEVLGADLIIHVRDISHADTETQATDVETILSTLGIDTERPRLEVWNKIDLLDAEEGDAIRARAERDPAVFGISAVTGEGLDALLETIAEQIQGARHVTEMVLGFSEGKKRAWLFQQDLVISETQSEDGFALTVQWTAVQQAQFDSL